MSSTKRFLAFFVVVTLMLGIMAPAFGAPVPEDAIGTDYEAAARRLAQFDIMIGDETGSFQGAREITRAEMAKIVVAMQGLSSAAELAHGATPFIDVEPSHWASGCINVAYNAGLILGTSGNTFEPDRKVTYQEAITMIVRAIGYVRLAGNWPVNYINKGTQLGLTDGLAVSGLANGVRGVVARMVNNALDAHPMKVARVDAYGNPIEYELEQDETVLTKFFNLTEVTGIALFTSNEDPDIEDDRVSILVDGEEKMFKIGDVEMAEHLGKEIVFYTKNGSTPETLAGIKEIKTSSDRIITPEKIENASSATEIVYEQKDGTTKTISGLDNVRIILNGKKADYSTVYNQLTDARPALKAQGAVGTIIKTTDSSAYMIVNTWTGPAVVTSVSERGKTISVEDLRNVGGSSRTANIDLSGDDMEYTIIADGRELEIGDVEKDDVVEILMSADNNKVTINVTRDSVSGAIEGIGYASAGKIDRLKIDGSYFKLNNPDEYQPSVTTGNEVKALLDANGEIEKVFIDGSIATGNYAVSLEVEEQTFGAFGAMKDAARIQLLLADGSKKVFTAVQGLRVYKADGSLSSALINDDTDATVKNKDNEDVANDLLDGAANMLANSMIRYQTNSNGELSRVSLIPTDQMASFTDIDYTKDSAKWGNYLMSSDTLIFNVSGGTAKVFKYKDLPDLTDADGFVIKVANSNFNEVEVIYITDQEVNAASSDYRVAMVVSRDEIDSDKFAIGLNDGTEVFILENEEGANLDAAYPTTLVKFKVNGSNRITEIIEMEAEDKLFDSDLAAEHLITSIEAGRGLISVSDGTYDDAITENVGSSPIVFDVSDYHANSTVRHSDREIRTMTLGSLIIDKMFIKVYTVEIDNVETTFILVTQNTDTAS